MNLKSKMSVQDTNTVDLHYEFEQKEINTVENYLDIAS